MAKQSALGANLYFGNYDLSGDVGVISSISSPRATLDITSLDKAAPERILTRRDGSISFAGFWNAAVGQVVAALQTLPTTDVLATVAIPATGTLAVGDPACAINGKQITLDQAFGADGSLGVTTQIQSNGTTLEWGQLMTAGKVTIGTGTVNGTGVDSGIVGGTALGASAYLHVFSIASGTMGVKFQDSTDGASDWADISPAMAFTDVTAATSQRISTGLTAAIRRHVRLTTTGVHGNAVMAVLFVRHLTSQAI